VHFWTPLKEKEIIKSPPEKIETMKKIEMN